MDLTVLSLDELKRLQERIPAEIKRREKDAKAKILGDLKKVASDAGFDLNELLAGAEKDVAKIKRAVAPKYKHPTDVALTWTGRGKKPRWVADCLASGKSLDQLAI